MKRILTTLIAMCLTTTLVIAQQTQTPINITTLTAQPSPAQFTLYSGLNATFTFNTQNTTNAQFCQGTDTCTLPTASTGPNAYTVSNTRWGTYKLNNPNAGS